MQRPRGFSTFGGPAQRPMATNYRPLFYVAGFIAFWLLLAGAAGLGVAIGALVRDNYHHDRTHNHIRAIGFSVYKNGTQSVTDNTTTIVTAWTADLGYPAYDRTGGQFDVSSGVFSPLKTNFRYIATATICFAATANGTREIRLVTTGANAAIVYDRAEGSAGLSGDQCLNVNQIIVLPKDTTANPVMVWVEAFTDSGNTETITTESRFGIERIAVDNPH